MARLNSLSVQGFRSIRALQGLPLTSMNILLGGNGSGKSNLLELFSFIRAVMQLPLPGFRETDLTQYVLDTGGASDLLYKGRLPAKAISFTLHFDDAAYTMELVPFGDNLLRIQSEEVFDKCSGLWQQVRSPDGITPGLLQYKDSEEVDGMQGMHVLASSVYRSIQEWKSYHIKATGRLSPMKSSQSIYDHAYLLPDGSNLASFLFFLKESPQFHHSYALIVSSVCLIAPFFEDFILEANAQDMIRLFWKQKGSDSPMKPQMLSEGTLRFICLATALLQPHASCLIIDEPELGLHPTAIAILAELMQARSTDTQLIVATQSQDLINFFGQEDIIVCNREEGQSTFTRLDPDSLDIWLEDYSLGELWVKNILVAGPVYE